MSETSIFHDRSKLSSRYIPNELHHRENEMSLLLTMFKDSYIKPDEFLFSTPQIVGRSGIGKTSTILKFSKMLENEFIKSGLTLKVAYINLKLQGGNKYAVYRFLLEKIAPELPSQGLSAEEMLRYLLSYLTENKLYTLIILDEIEFLLRSNKDSGIIYDFTRLNEFDLSKHCNVIGVVFIARSTDFHDKIESSELSTLGRLPIEFKPYSIDEISDILLTRTSESFNPNVVGTDIIDEVSLITTSSQVGGDVRYALDLLLYAGNLAEANGSERITLDQIRKAHGYNKPSLTIEDLKELPRSHLLTLMAILKVQNKRKKQYIELKEIRVYALELADEYKIKKFEFEDSMNELLERKIVEMKSLKEIGMSITSLVELEPLLEQQINKK